ncbi:MAG: phosphate/phosphite/phosphonate ABC transporter substrate-binding protein [Pseudomonadales bacterium]|nr:phosphate/phosphite/phosphonate ABC transporter substrate-binding protein [Pseudomonadales bacterium]
MTRRSGRLASVTGIWLFCISMLAPLISAAEACPRGDLDARYCDADNDLVADLPTSPDGYLHPRALVFAYTPVEDPAVYRDVWSGFLDHLAAVTGLRVIFFPVQSNAAQIEAMRSGRLHVAGFNTGSTPLAVNCAGFSPFTMMAAADDSFGYEMELITRPDSGISTPQDLRGRNLAFSSPTSNSGFKAPSAILEAEFGLIRDRDFTAAFSGKHDNTILGVINRDYDAGAVANSVKQRMLARGIIHAEDLRILYRSQTFPTTAYGHVYNLAPEIAARVREAFRTFDWEGSRLKAEFNKSGEEKFIPVTYKEHWSLIRQIDAANGVTYSCR